MKVDIGIPGNDIEDIATLLNTLLADEYILYTKTRNAHWNVTGQNFDGLHKFFQDQHIELNEMIDEIAERIRSLGHFALGYFKDFLSVTHLTEESNSFSNPEQIIQTLFNDHETIIRIIRKQIQPVSVKHKDVGTADFLVRLMERQEKMAWMLRAYLS